mmetsp:Transcript_9586/g.20422  ORF Transcript_9586/g.20422 Transcript_9586/m.20422 type:complete len:458 (-) Transcript_9586:436-1809(-)
MHGDHVVVTRNADLAAKVVDGGGGHATAAHACQREQAGVVPAVDVSAHDQLVELALGHDGVGDVEARVLPHKGLVGVQHLKQPVVGCPSRLKLEGAERVRDVLQCVHQAVRVVVGGVDAPLVACVGVLSELDAVRDQVKHVVVVVLVVHLHAQCGLALVHHAPPHVLKQLQALLNGAVAPGAGLTLLTTHLNLILGLVAYVCIAALDELHREVIQLVKVVGGVGDLPGLPPHPRHNLLDVLNVLQLLSLRVGVIVPQVAHSVVLPGHAKVHKHGLGMSNVQVAVGLWGEAGHHLVAGGRQVLRQLLGGVRNAHDAPVAEVDRGVHLVVLGRLRQEGVGVLGDSGLSRLGFSGGLGLGGGLLGCLSWLGLGLLLGRLEVLLCLGAQQSLHLGLQLSTDSTTICPFQSPCHSTQNDVQVAMIPFFLQLSLVRLDSFSDCCFNLVGRDHNTNTASLLQSS